MLPFESEAKMAVAGARRCVSRRGRTVRRVFVVVGWLRESVWVAPKKAPGSGGGPSGGVSALLTPLAMGDRPITSVTKRE